MFIANRKLKGYIVRRIPIISGCASFTLRDDSFSEDEVTMLANKMPEATARILCWGAMGYGGFGPEGRLLSICGWVQQVLKHKAASI